jgi:hypothetical protein
MMNLLILELKLFKHRHKLGLGDLALARLVFSHLIHNLLTGVLPPFVYFLL